MLNIDDLPGCKNGIGKGNYLNGASGGAGHGGRGGSGFYNGKMSGGGDTYGSPNLPCELGSGSEGPHAAYGHVAGGGMIGKLFCRNTGSKKNILVLLNLCFFFMHSDYVFYLALPLVFLFMLKVNLISCISFVKILKFSNLVHASNVIATCITIIHMLVYRWLTSLLLPERHSLSDLHQAYLRIVTAWVLFIPVTVIFHLK